MSQENVEIVRRLLTARREQAPDLFAELLAELLDPAVRLDVTFLCRLRSGRVSEIRSYDDGGRALRDAELEG